MTEAGNLEARGLVLVAHDLKPPVQGRSGEIEHDFNMPAIILGFSDNPPEDMGGYLMKLSQLI